MADFEQIPYEERAARRGWRRRLRISRLALVLAGGVALGILVLVVAIVIVLHSGRSHTAAGVPQTFAAPRAGDTGAIALAANAATVSIHALDTSNPNLLQGSFTPGKGRGDANLQHKGDTWRLSEESADPNSGETANWDVGIAPGVALNLTLSLNASSSDVDLKAATLTGLSADACASALRLVLPTTYSGDVKGKVNASAGNVQITVPPGAAVRLIIETKGGSRDVPARFTQRNGGYETPDYASAKNRLILTVYAPAGRVTVI